MVGPLTVPFHKHILLPPIELLFRLQSLAQLTMPLKHNQLNSSLNFVLILMIALITDLVLSWSVLLVCQLPGDKSQS